ncbi:MAG: sulfatase, partial [Verrucomicrobia bacterium]
IGNTRDTTDGLQPVKVSLFLANLKTDPGEKTNLADRHPDIVARLHTLHQEHLN